MTNGFEVRILLLHNTTRGDLIHMLRSNLSIFDKSCVSVHWSLF